ncbi:MAG: hemerythrin domain-containing protein [Actinomycetota bacterium]
MPDYTDAESALAREFLKDHQGLSRGLVALRDAVGRNDLEDAKALADRIDRSAGGHMEFEERLLYPHVARIFGAEYVDRLYAEHRLGKAAIARVLARPGAEPLRAEEQSTLLAELDAVGEHVYSCGALLSHLTALDEPAQQRMLERLLEFRREHRRWTELPSPDAWDDVRPARNAADEPR